MVGAAVDVSQQRRVVSCPDPSEMRFKDSREACRLRLQGGFIARIGEQLDRFSFEKGALLGQCPGLFIGRGEVAGFDLGCLDVGLVKRVDPDN